jgi:hypothetical protein
MRAPVLVSQAARSMMQAQGGQPVALRLRTDAIMSFRKFRVLLAVVAATAAATPLTAQDASAPDSAEFKTSPDDSRCELHIWPIDNYTTDMSGLLSAIPVFGFAIDQGKTKNRRQAIQDLMREYLSPQIQVDLLSGQGVANALGLAGYEIIVEKAYPSAEDLKQSKELRAERKVRFAAFKRGTRQVESASDCYAELAVTVVAYRDTVQLKSNMFVGWSYRYFGASPTAQYKFSDYSGGVPSGSLNAFPPATEADVEPARNEMQSQFIKGFREFAWKVRR